MNNMLKTLGIYINNKLDKKVAYWSIPMWYIHALSSDLPSFYLNYSIHRLLWLICIDKTLKRLAQCNKWGEDKTLVVKIAWQFSVKKNKVKPKQKCLCKLMLKYEHERNHHNFLLSLWCIHSHHQIIWCTTWWPNRFKP